MKTLVQKRKQMLWCCKSLKMIAFSIPMIFNSSISYAQNTNQECQAEIKKMREIYIVILRKIPAMPPLAQLSPGIERALNEAEMNRNSGDYRSCVINMQRQISIVERYAR